MGIYIINADEFVYELEDFLMSQEGEIHKDTLIESWNKLSKKHGWNEKIIEKLKGGNQDDRNKKRKN